MQGGGGGGEEVSIEELASNLATYEDQLHQVPLIFLFLFSILMFICSFFLLRLYMVSIRFHA
jgi:hypothetical protein